VEKGGRREGVRSQSNAPPMVMLSPTMKKEGEGKGKGRRGGGEVLVVAAGPGGGQRGVGGQGGDSRGGGKGEGGGRPLIEVASICDRPLYDRIALVGPDGERERGGGGNEGR